MCAMLTPKEVIDPRGAGGHDARETGLRAGTGRTMKTLTLVMGDMTHTHEVSDETYRFFAALKDDDGLGAALRNASSAEELANVGGPGGSTPRPWSCGDLQLRSG